MKIREQSILVSCCSIGASLNGRVGVGGWGRVGQVPAAPDSRGRPLLFVSTLRSQIIQNEELKSFRKKKIRIFIM